MFSMVWTDERCCCNEIFEDFGLTAIQSDACACSLCCDYHAVGRQAPLLRLSAYDIAKLKKSLCLAHKRCLQASHWHLTGTLLVASIESQGVSTIQLLFGETLHDMV